MFFILSKTIDFLLSPLVWIVGLLLFGLITKKPVYRKRSLYSGVFMLLFFSNPFIADLAFRAWEGEPVPMSSVGNYDLGIVLTGVAFNREEAPDRVFFSKGADRVMHTVQLYKAGKIKRILISGGSGLLIGKGIPEAARLKEVMLYSGVPDSAIIVETVSRNTRENAIFSKKVVDSLGIKRDVLLVTSAFHMNRSVGCFKETGMDVHPFKTDFYNGDLIFDLDYLVPDENSLINWSVIIHEMAGVVMYKLLGYQ